jgi:hypothetical protein
MYEYCECSLYGGDGHRQKGLFMQMRQCQLLKNKGGEGAIDHKYKYTDNKKNFRR